MLFIVTWAIGLTAQVTQLDIDPRSGCNFAGAAGQEGPIYGFKSSREAEETVSDILRQVGLPQNFKIRAANVPNAQAHVSRGERYILYSQRFMEEIFNHSGDYWSKIAVLAHEIGHHLLGHTLKDDGSRPVKELEADQWSGFVLHKMGATLVEAQLAVASLASEEGSPTHPGKEVRLEAIAVGYNEARELNEKKQEASASAEKKLAEQKKAGSEQPRNKPAAEPEKEESLVVRGKTTFRGQEYGTIEVNGLVWMTENLKLKPKNAWIYENDNRNYIKYGVLYTWDAAKQICDWGGWRLPTAREWQSLKGPYRENSNSAYRRQVEQSFNIQHGGHRFFNINQIFETATTSGFSKKGLIGFYWTSNEISKNKAISYQFVRGSFNTMEMKRERKGSGFSCRCVKDAGK